MRSQVKIAFLLILVSQITLAQLRPLWRDSLGFIVPDPFKTVKITSAAPGSGIQMLNGLNPVTQTFAIDSANANWGINSSGSTHTFRFPGGRLFKYSDTAAFRAQFLKNADSTTERNYSNNLYVPKPLGVDTTVASTWSWTGSSLNIPMVNIPRLDKANHFLNKQTLDSLLVNGMGRINGNAGIGGTSADASTSNNVLNVGHTIDSVVFQVNTGTGPSGYPASASFFNYNAYKGVSTGATTTQGIVNRSTVDSSYSVLVFGSIAGNGTGPHDNAKIMSQNLNHTAGSFMGDLAFILRSGGTEFETLRLLHDSSVTFINGVTISKAGALVASRIGVGTSPTNQKFELVGGANMRMNSGGGDVSIGWDGNTSASAANPLIYSNGSYLVVNSKAGSPLYLNFDNTNASSPVNFFAGKATIDKDGNLLALGVYSKATSARAVFVDADGSIGTLTSSRRYKRDIVPLEVDTRKLYDLHPVSFTRKSSGKREFGLIAEDVNRYIPAIVGKDSLGRPDYVAYERLPVLLLSELQKHEKRIDEQDRIFVRQAKEISELRKEIAKLRRKK